MKAVDFGELKYLEWEKVNEYTFERKCFSQNLRIYTAIIKIEKDKYICEVPFEMPIKMIIDMSIEISVKTSRKIQQKCQQKCQ